MRRGENNPSCIKTIDYHCVGLNGQIEIIGIADTHIGDPLVDYELLDDCVKYIKSHKNCYWIANGDLINNAIKQSPSNVYMEQLSPKAQVDKICSILKPIKDKCIAYIPGNHEYDRNLKEVGDITPADLIAINLGVEDRYAPGGAVIYLSMTGIKGSNKKATMFKIFAQHGSGGSTATAGKMSKLKQMANIFPDADVYLKSHTHEPMFTIDNRLKSNDMAHSVVEEDRVFVNTGAFLKYGGYGQNKGLAPTSRKIPVIILGAMRKSFMNNGKEYDFVSRYYGVKMLTELL